MELKIKSLSGKMEIATFFQGTDLQDWLQVVEEYLVLMLVAVLWEVVDQDRCSCCQHPAHWR